MHSLLPVFKKLSSCDVIYLFLLPQFPFSGSCLIPPSPPSSCEDLHVEAAVASLVYLVLCLVACQLSVVQLILEQYCYLSNSVSQSKTNSEIYGSEK